MFATAGSRIGSLLLRGIDRTVEFATLGEYGLGGAEAGAWEQAGVNARAWARLSGAGPAVAVIGAEGGITSIAPAQRAGLQTTPQRIAPATVAARALATPPAVAPHTDLFTNAPAPKQMARPRAKAVAKTIVDAPTGPQLGDARHRTVTPTDAVRQLAFASGTRAPRAAPRRTRGGSAAPATQICLWTEA